MYVGVSNGVCLNARLEKALTRSGIDKDRAGECADHVSAVFQLLRYWKKEEVFSCDSRSRYSRSG